MFNLETLNQKITHFTHSHDKTLTEIIALLKAQNLLLTQILNEIKTKSLCQN